MSQGDCVGCGAMHAWHTLTALDNRVNLLVEPGNLYSGCFELLLHLLPKLLPISCPCWPRRLPLALQGEDAQEVLCAILDFDLDVELRLERLEQLFHARHQLAAAPLSPRLSYLLFGAFGGHGGQWGVRRSRELVEGAKGV